MEITIRDYSPADKEAVERCLLELQEEEYVRQPEYWQTPEETKKGDQVAYLVKWMGESNGKLLVAEVDGAVVGYIAVYIYDGKDSSPSIKISPTGYIPDFAVLRSYQKRGIGKKLLDAAEQYVKSQKCEYISLHVTVDNPALNFYEKFGYKEWTAHLKKKL